jgi:hypothetical protein
MPLIFDELSGVEKRHFYKCEQRGEMVDMRQLDDVLFHENHVHRADIQYGGSEHQSNERTSLADAGRKERTGGSR